MNYAAIGLAALALASAATAASAAPATDMDYLKASRCRGIAVATGADASALDAYLKAAAHGRTPYVLDRADQEFAKARRQAQGEAKTRLAAELSGPCASYAAPAKTVASR